MYCCKQVGLSFEEMDLMTLGGCLDYIQEYIDNNRRDSKGNRIQKPRKANQADFNAF